MTISEFFKKKKSHNRVERVSPTRARLKFIAMVSGNISGYCTTK